MKKACVFLCLCSVAICYGIPQQKGISLEFAEYGGPLIPTLSRVSAEIPGSMFGGSPFLGRLRIGAWYLAYSPFLWPDPMLEIGARINYRITNRERSALYAGLGTAFEYFDGSFGIPLIANLDGASDCSTCTPPGPCSKSCTGRLPLASRRLCRSGSTTVRDLE